MKYFDTHLGVLRTGLIFDTWYDEYDKPDNAPVRVFYDGSVNDWYSGDPIAPPLSPEDLPDDWDDFDWQET